MPLFDKFLEKEHAIKIYAENSHRKYFNLDKYFSLGLIPVFSYSEKKYVLKNDFFDFLNGFTCTEPFNGFLKLSLDLFEENCADILRINEYSYLKFQKSTKLTDPTFFSAFRNLACLGERENIDLNREPYRLNYFCNTILVTLSKRTFDLAKKQLSRNSHLNKQSTSFFARSAHYMGSKKALVGFLVEGISSELSSDATVLDLMCGSGSASGAFNRFWNTFASDSQEFCKNLSAVQGGGFSHSKASSLLSRIIQEAKKHFSYLTNQLEVYVDTEDNLFCRESNEALLHSYDEFVENFPTYVNGKAITAWNPYIEVQSRKENNFKYPYCLFTTYFANVYFGLRQCIEIDSLRYSIDKVCDSSEKIWALGALINTLSALSSTYGGHFAQPRVKKHSELGLKGLSKIIDKRSLSIIHEFTIRLLNLSQQSEEIDSQIKIVDGPWRRSLDLLYETNKYQSKVLVYLDAPYKREEYSRYYHVLETLVLYNYPSCTGTGLTPKPSDRFKSEFFTKNKLKIEMHLSDIISEILNKGWMCAWSYSDSADANVIATIQRISENLNFDVKSYAVPFIHKPHGGVRAKRVLEYLIVFKPV